MMNSTWVKAEIETLFADCDSLQDVIRKIETIYTEKGQVVCEVHVNGMLLSEKDESRFSLSKRSELNEITIVASEPQLLIRQALRSTIDFLPGFQEDCLVTSEALRAGDLDKGLRRFREVVENCQWLVETLKHVRGASVAVGRPIDFNEQWSMAEKKITESVREVLSAKERDDFVLIADLLEYEFSTVTESWLEVLTHELSIRV